MVITRYEVTRHYGGPEEGGWYYDRSKAIEVIATVEDGATNEESRVMRSALNALAKERRVAQGRPQGRGSVAGGADEVFMAEDEFGEHDDTNEPRPYYC